MTSFPQEAGIENRRLKTRKRQDDCTNGLRCRRQKGHLLNQTKLMNHRFLRTTVRDGTNSGRRYHPASLRKDWRSGVRYSETSLPASPFTVVHSHFQHKCSIWRCNSCGLKNSCSRLVALNDEHSDVHTGRYWKSFGCTKHFLSGTHYVAGAFPKSPIWPWFLCQNGGAHATLPSQTLSLWWKKKSHMADRTVWHGE